MAKESTASSDYVQLEKLKRALPQKLRHLAEQKKCKNISQLGLVLKQSRDKIIQSHKSRSDIFDKKNCGSSPKKVKKIKSKTNSPTISAEYADKIIAKARKLKIIC